jgi:hypothetical protein
MTNYAFIDGQNLHSGIQSLGWSLDTLKLMTHLSQKYHVTRAFYFIGFMPQQQALYTRRTRFGYDLQFKPVVQGSAHPPKGNVDADLVLKAMIELSN